MLLEAGKQSRWKGEMGVLGQEKRFLTLERKSGQAPWRRQDLSWNLQRKQGTGALAEGTARAEGLWQRAQPRQRPGAKGAATAGSEDCQVLGWSGLGVARARHTGKAGPDLKGNRGASEQERARAWWGSRERG